MEFGEVLGTAQSWWTIAGIALDIVGVTVLFGEAFLVTFGLKAFLGKHEDPEREGPLMMGAAPLGEKADGLPEIDVTDMPENIAEAIRLLEERFAMEDFSGRATAAHEYILKGHAKPRRRILLVTGLVLLVVGFMLQIIGAWPL
ncbi:MAG: hypothetical protein GY761_05250 [Hyphomicrobiales bacterium]|nr:hypothetical protein [Hyphomicrobiales bacterium]